MKKLGLILGLLFFVVVVNAQEAAKKTDTKAKETKEVKMKDHACTDVCKDGKHVYACGEKGHTCSKDCKHEKQAMKDHACTDACKDGKHVYACGEKGHTCTKECKHEGHDHGKHEGHDKH